MGMRNGPHEGGAAHYEMGSVATGFTRLRSEMTVPALPRNQSGITFFLWTDVFTGDVGQGRMNQLVPQLLLGDVLSGSTGPPDYAPLYSSFSSWMFGAHYFFELLNETTGDVDAHAAYGALFPASEGEVLFTSFDVDEGGGPAGPAWVVRMGVVGDATRVSTLVVAQPYMGMGANWSTPSTSWSELNFTDICINACWEIYGGVDVDHLPSSGATYTTTIERGAQQTYPWVAQWDTDEGANTTCFASSIAEAHTPRVQTLQWNISAAPAPSSGWYASTAHGAQFRNVRAAPYACAGDGVTDDTACLQAALTEGRGVAHAKQRAVVFLPPGRYLVSDTLLVYAFTTLRGDSVAPPTLVLARGAAGFGNASALKPLLATTGGFGRDPSARDWWTDGFAANLIFYVECLSFNVDVSGSAGAVGIFWNVAQQTTLRSVFINAAGAFSGLDVGTSRGYAHAAGAMGTGGGGTVEDVDIVGGEYSMRVEASQWTFRALRLRGAARGAVGLTGMAWVLTWLDCSARDTPALIVPAGEPGGGLDRAASHLLLLDVVLDNVTGAAAAILLPPGGAPVLLENVTLTGSPPRLLVATSDGDAWLPPQPHTARWAAWAGGSNATGLFVHGVAAAGGAARAALPGARGSALASRARPWLDDLPAPPCNARTDCGAAGDNATDDTAALRACLVRCAAVFLPAAAYRVTDTLALRDGSILVGEGLASLWLAPRSAGFGDAAAPKPLLDTPDDAGATVLLLDVALQAGGGNAGAVLLRWRCGAASGAWDVHLNVSTNIATALWASGAGAGYLANVWAWGAGRSQWTLAPMTEDAAATGFLGESAGPLFVLGSAFEHHRDAMVNLTNARGYTLVTLQTEQVPGWLKAAGNATVHLALGAGTTDTVVYGALLANWWAPHVNRSILVDADVGTGVSLFGVREMGAVAPVVGQALPVAASGGWWSVLADVEI